MEIINNCNIQSRPVSVNPHNCTSPLKKRHPSYTDLMSNDILNAKNAIFMLGVLLLFKWGCVFEYK